MAGRERMRPWSVLRKDGPLPALLVVGFAAVLCYAPDLFLPMLLRAFLWQWVWLFLLMVAWNLVLRRWWSSAAFLCGAVLAYWPTSGLLKDTPVPAEAGHVLRIAQMNILQENKRYPEVIREALASHADVISFQEVDPTWAGVLDQGLVEDMPYRRTVAGTDRYGIALYSKMPFLQAEVLDLEGRPAVRAVLDTPAGPLALICVHTSSPGSLAGFRQRQAQLARIAQLAAGISEPLVVIGDLNTVSWDDAFLKLCRSTGLREPMEAPRATWPTAFGRSLIPLDHILTSSQLGLTDLVPMRIPGSDHRGLVAHVRSRRP